MLTLTIIVSVSELGREYNRLLAGCSSSSISLWSFASEWKNLLTWHNVRKSNRFFFILALCKINFINLGCLRVFRAARHCVGACSIARLIDPSCCDVQEWKMWKMSMWREPLMCSNWRDFACSPQTLLCFILLLLFLRIVAKKKNKVGENSPT